MKLLHAIAIVAASLFWACAGAVLLLIAALAGLTAKAAGRVSDWAGRLSASAAWSAFWCAMRIGGF